MASSPVSGLLSPRGACGCNKRTSLRTSGSFGEISRMAPAGARWELATSKNCRTRATSSTGTRRLASRPPRAWRGSRGSVTNSSPSSVMFPSASSAPNWRSVAKAAAALFWGKGSGSARPSPMGAPQAETSSSAPVRSLVWIAGAANSGKRAHSCALIRRNTVPGPSRPARPARCTQLAWAADSVTRTDMPREESRRETRDRHVSTTTRTPGTVIEDSATSVAKMTRRMALEWAVPRGLTIADCCFGLSWPCSAKAASSGESNCWARSSVPRMVGTKARMSPSVVSASARRTPAAMKASMEPGWPGRLSLRRWVMESAAAA